MTDRGRMTPGQLDAWRSFGRGEISWDQYQAAHQAAAPNTERPRSPRPKRMELRPPADAEGYMRVPAVIYRDPRVRGAAWQLLALLVQLARGRGQVTAYIDQLADLLRCSRRHVQRCQARLAEVGAITVTRRRTGRINDANLYAIADYVTARPPTPRGRRGGDISVTPRGRALRPASPLTPPRKREGVSKRTRQRARARSPSQPSPVDGGGLPATTGPPPSPD